MRILDVKHLKPGRQFPHPLFHETGRKLIGDCTLLTPAHIEALVRTGVERVYVAVNAKAVLDFVNTTVKTIPVVALHVGDVVESDLLTPDGVVMIHQNEQIEAHHLAALQDSEIDFLIPRPLVDQASVLQTLEGLEQIVVSRIQGFIQRGEYLRAPESRDPLIQTIDLGNKVAPANMSGMDQIRNRLANRLRPIFGMLETGRIPPHKAVDDIADELLKLLKESPRTFSQLALIADHREDYLPDHAIAVAALSALIALHMRLSADLVKEAALGGLLCDVGMLMLPKRIRTQTGVVSAEDRKQIQRHPLYSLTMLEQIPSLSPIPRLVALQHHERLGQNGYPNKSVPGTISDFAKIVSVADIFAAIANPRAYRDTRIPHVAVDEILNMARQGQVEVRAVKALLAGVGLFPVGSYVLLSSGQSARVVGANPNRMDRPIVQTLNDGKELQLDLSHREHESIRVMQPIVPPTPSDGPKPETRVPENAAA